MEEKRRFSISGSTLKIIAIVTMTIDHIAAVLLEPMLIAVSGEWRETLILLYQVLRGIGRLAFPIFCFLLVEGFLHTSNSRRYLLRLGIFAAVSEVPFDLAFHQKWYDSQYQNVFFTLFFGFIAMMGIFWCRNRMTDGLREGKQWLYMLGFFGQFAVTLFCALAAWFLHTDYGWYGVMVIALLYLLHTDKVKQILSGAVLFFINLNLESLGAAAFLPIALYNGKRGIRMKYFFYLYYPAHLLILAIICSMFIFP